MSSLDILAFLYFFDGLRVLGMVSGMAFSGTLKIEMDGYMWGVEVEG